MRYSTKPILVALLALAASPSLAAAQRGGSTLAAGINRYDIQGASGTDWVIAARFAIPVGAYGIAEPGVTFLRWRPAIGTKITYLIPELSFQMQGYVKSLRPYIGAGIGYSTPSRGALAVTENFLALHAAAGVRLYLSRRWGLRAEVRARSINPWSGTTIDMTFGIMQLTGGRM